MRTDMRGKDFVTLMDFTGEEIETILEVGFDLKRQNAVGCLLYTSDAADE